MRSLVLAAALALAACASNQPPQTPEQWAADMRRDITEQQQRINDLPLGPERQQFQRDLNDVSKSVAEIENDLY